MLNPATRLDVRSRLETPESLPSPAWVRLIGPSLSICAIGVLGFAYAALLLSGLSGKARDLALFVFAVGALPPLCAVVQTLLVRQDVREPKAGYLETIHCWLAVTLLLALAALPVMIFLTGATDAIWTRGAGLVVAAVATLHALALLAATKPFASLRKRLPAADMAASRVRQSGALMLSLLAALFALFWIDPSNREMNLFIRLFVEPPFAGERGSFPLGSAVALALLAAAAVAITRRFESRLLRGHSKSLQRGALFGIFLVPLVTVVFLFDFSLMHDALHYMTIVGPALHVLHGGTPMVDTFSQYGPGPVLLTVAGFLIGPVRFTTTQITVQLFNFAFYAVWLVCLYRMTSWKLTALFLGVLVIALFHAAWGRGFGNVNEAPSILAFRHLPVLLMVLTLSCLAPPRRHSAATAAVTFVSALWSAETLIGSLGVHLAFLGLVGLRDHAYRRLAFDGVAAVLPALASVPVMAAATLLRAGTLPDYPLYLQYLSAYSMVSTYWSIPANPLFLGWAAMLLTAYLVFADAWSRVLDPARGVTGVDNDALFYRFVPMAALLILQATYFVGRSVDFTLLMALFPFSALAISGTLAAVGTLASERGPVRLFMLAPVAVGVWAMTFICLSLLRQGNQYSLWVHECRDLGRCSPAALAQELKKTIDERTVLEHVRKPDPDGWYDKDGIVRDALAMLDGLAAREPAVPVLLGRLQGDLDLWASEFALMYAGKWDRWPRSFTLSDQLVPDLAQRIIAAPITLREGELVLVRRDERRLGFLETEILKRIRAQITLCPIPHPSQEVAAYRVAGPAGCSAG